MDYSEKWGVDVEEAVNLPWQTLSFQETRSRLPFWKNLQKAFSG